MPRLRPTLLAACLIAIPTLARAQPTPGREALKQHCIGDYLEHCSMHPPGGPAVEACFRANMRKLSPGCAAAIRAFRRETRATGRPNRGR